MILQSILIRLMQNLVFCIASDPESFNTLIYFNKQELKFLIVKLFWKAFMNIAISSCLNTSVCSLRVLGLGKRGTDDCLEQFLRTVL